MHDSLFAILQYNNSHFLLVILTLDVSIRVRQYHISHDNASALGTIISCRQMHVY